MGFTVFRILVFATLLALSVGDSLWAADLHEQAAQFSAIGARGAISPAQAMMFTQAMNANKQTANSNKESSSGTSQSTSVTPPKNNFQQLSFDNSALPSAISSVSSSSEPNVLGGQLGSSPSSGNGSIGAMISEQTAKIAAAGKKAREADAARTEEEILAAEKASLEEIVNITLPVKKEIDSWKERRAKKEEFKAQIEQENADQPKTNADKLAARLPASDDRGTDRSQRLGRQTEAEKLLKDITPE